MLSKTLKTLLVIGLLISFSCDESDGNRELESCTEDLEQKKVKVKGYEDAECKKIEKLDSGLIDDFEESTSIYSAGENNLGGEWGVFQDSKYGGRSILIWEAIAESGNYVMKLDYYIDKGNSNFIPYAGVCSYLSYPPFQVYDFSDFKSISIDVKIIPSEIEEEVSELPEIALQLASIGVHENAWHEVPIDIETGSNFIHREYLLEQFDCPVWSDSYECTTPIDVTKIFKIAIVIRGVKYEERNGTFYIDNITLH